MTPQNIMLLKTAALSSSDALDSIPKLATFVTRRTKHFPHLLEVLEFWLGGAITAGALLSSDIYCLRVHEACLLAIKDYAYNSSRRTADGLVLYRHLHDSLWPLLVAYSEKLFVDFSSDLEDLTFYEYIPAILRPLCLLIWTMTDSRVDVNNMFYSSLMSDTVVGAMIKSWIKIFSHVESYGDAHCSMQRCLSATMLKDKHRRGNNSRYQPLFDSIPPKTSKACIDRAKDILRPANRDVKEVTATLEFLILIASCPADMRVMYYDHGMLYAVFRYFSAIARRPPPKTEDIAHECMFYLELGLNETDRGFLPLFNLRGLRNLLLSPNYVVGKMAVYLYKLIDTMCLQCVDPDVYHHLKRVLREEWVNETRLPEEIRRPLEVLFTTMKELAPAMQHADIRRFRLCAREECRMNSCRYRCSGCKHALYCSLLCRKQDWACHRSKCEDVLARYRFGFFFSISKYDPDGGWRTAFFDHIVQYELFKSPRRDEIAERRASFIRQHPLLPPKEVAFRMDFEEGGWSVSVFQVEDYDMLNRLAGCIPDAVSVMWRVPLPSLMERTRAFCIFEGEELCIDPFGGSVIAL